MRHVTFVSKGKTDDHVEFVSIDGARSRVEFPSGSRFHGQVVVDDGADRLHFYPQRKLLRIEPSPLEDAPTRLVAQVVGSNGRGFRIEVADGGEIAGCRASEVTVYRAKGQIVQSIWIEPDSGVVLKREAYDGKGSLIGSFQFDRIDLNARPAESLFRLNPAGARISTPELDLQKIERDNKLQELEVDRRTGFRLQSAKLVAASAVTIVQEVYISVAGRATLYQSKYAMSDDALMRAAPPRTHVYSWQNGNESFTLVGQLDASTLRNLAQSLTTVP